jgi:hypothetical protein
MVKLQFQRFGHRPPPFLDLLFRAEIENPHERPMWFLFPLIMEEPMEFDELLASAVEISEFSGKGFLRVARFLGDRSFQAMRLSPQASVRIDEFTVTFMGDLQKAEVAVPVIVTECLMIGEQNAESWFPVDLTSASHVEVVEEPGAIVASKDTPMAKAVPVNIGNSRILKLTIPLKNS